MILVLLFLSDIFFSLPLHFLLISVSFPSHFSSHFLLISVSLPPHPLLIFSFPCHFPLSPHSPRSKGWTPPAWSPSLSRLTWISGPTRPSSTCSRCHTVKYWLLYLIVMNIVYNINTDVYDYFMGAKESNQRCIDDSTSTDNNATITKI